MFAQGFCSRLLLAFACLVPLTGFSFAQDKTAQTIQAQSKLARLPEWASPIDQSQNLFQVTPTFYRSAQLAKSDVAVLQELKIKTVLSLRAFHSDDALFRDSGVSLKRVPINTWHLKDAQVIAALKIIRQAEQEGPVLLHCLHGADRTGTITAMYRMVYMGWTREAAIRELKEGGFGYHSMWTNLIRYLERVDVEAIKRQVES